jgi:hypothetical protein
MKPASLAVAVALASILAAGCGGGSTNQPAKQDMFTIANRVERSVTKLEPYATTPPRDVLCLPASLADYMCQLRWKAPPPGGITPHRSKHLSLDVVVNGDATKFNTGAKSRGWMRLSQ